MGHKDDEFKKAKAHAEYWTSDGRPAIGVTTALKVLDKPALIYWAWNQGRMGLDLYKTKDILAEVGSIAHAMILHDLTGIPLDKDEYAPKKIALAENAFLQYLYWKDKHKVVPIRVEQAIVSDRHAVGGTPDFYGEIDDVREVADFKTGKAIYPEHFYQGAAYKEMLRENGFECRGVRIVNIPRNDKEEFDEKVRENVQRDWEIFIRCVEIYRLQRAKD